ncbi:Oidioi.mRNA.OKI2018_I69.chr2.g3946.t1.cds [Oikopleura dioica]|uniref:Oidioi.mRNA.OKI2018_I69.chr2.g3946.t1.cds n=1 Tax=Oikopleura dioica TaxID=34765 RepID=A0ABN7T011_OIKDI|nr:Oidioi.mRNA.OKI2018_I69.chr2.g3946.t1.cds [Oikopleura dioica]
MRLAGLIFGFSRACENGWVDDFQGNCLQIVSDPAPWHSALDNCFNQGAHMLHVNSESYNSAIKEMKIAKDLWIGYESPERMNGFFSSDGFSAIWQNFRTSGDERSDSEHNCASMMENGKWKKTIVSRKSLRLPERNKIGEKRGDRLDFHGDRALSRMVGNSDQLRRDQKSSGQSFKLQASIRQSCQRCVLARGRSQKLQMAFEQSKIQTLFRLSAFKSFSSDFDSLYREFFAEFEADMNETDWENISFDDEIRLSKENMKYEKAKNYVSGANECSSAMKQLEKKIQWINQKRLENDANLY